MTVNHVTECFHLMMLSLMTVFCHHVCGHTCNTHTIYSEVVLDCYSPTPYHYAMPKVGHLPPVRCPLSPVPVKHPLLVTCPLVKAHTKLPILHIHIWQWATETEITVRYGYAASIGSFVSVCGP